MSAFRCYRCLLPQPVGTDECRSCGSHAFIHGDFLPSWPPTFTVRVPGDRDPHILGGAFLLGDIPNTGRRA